MDAATLSILGRLAERLLAMMLAGMSLWAGYRLFFISSHERSSAEASGHGFVFKAERIGPGIFFALFGTVVIVYGLLTKLEFQTSSNPAPQPQSGTQPPPGTTSFSLGFPVLSGNDLPVEYKAINSLIFLVSKMDSNSDRLTGSDFQTAKNAINVLKQVQRSYVDARPGLGPGSYDLFLKIEEDCKQNSVLCEQQRTNPTTLFIYNRVKELVLQIDD